MHNRLITFAKLSVLAVVGIGVALGCVGGNPYLAASATTPAGTGTGGAGGTGGGGGTDPGGGGGGSSATDFIQISMRNTTLERIHYYLHFIAFAGPGGTVPADREVDYLNFGYIDTGSNIFTLGSLVIQAPSEDLRVLWYFHELGAFPDSSVGQAASLGGVGPTYDTYFDQIGAIVPVPDRILFYNGDFETDLCALRSFRRTDSAGSFTLEWFGPDLIQGTGCNCRALVSPFQVLAPSIRSPNAPFCDEYFRGASILYEFREVTDPTVPDRLVWQVDLGGTSVQAFSSP